jgi:AcrR family transcriptional regulator
MAEGGPENVTISAITDRADLGAGTFYNYFTSRDEIVEAVIASTVEITGQRLDALTAGMQDAAEIYSFSLRHLLRTAITDPLWGWLVVRLGVAHEELIATLGPRCRRDLMIGVNAGRFHIPDVDLATSMTFGALLSAMHTRLSGGGPRDLETVFAEFMLRMVGVSHDEARLVTRRELPPLPSLERARQILGLDADDGDVS